MPPKRKSANKAPASEQTVKTKTTGLPEPPKEMKEEALIPVWDAQKGCMTYMKAEDVERLAKMSPNGQQEARKVALATQEPSDYMPAAFQTDMVSPFIDRPMGPIIRRQLVGSDGKTMTDEEAVKKGWQIVVDHWGKGDLMFYQLTNTPRGPRILRMQHPDRKLAGEKHDSHKYPQTGNMLRRIGFPWDMDLDLVFGKTGGAWAFIGEPYGNGRQTVLNEKGQTWEIVCLQARLAWNADACAANETSEAYTMKKTHTVPDFYKFAIRLVSAEGASAKELEGLKQQREALETRMRQLAGL